MKLVVNLLGSPGCGKTVAATSLFSHLKRKHLNVALVSEFATEKVIEENTRALQNQIIIWATQQYRIFCAYEHADVVVTDSPILLGAIYNQNNPDLRKVILNEHHKYNNINFLMQLDDSYPYSMIGRVHTPDDSRVIQKEISDLLITEGIAHVPYHVLSEDDLVDLVLAAIDDS